MDRAKQQRGAWIEELCKGPVPRHVAIIMDGNGRWATSRGKMRVEGHRAGVERLRSVLRFSDDLGIEVLTVYAFSSENWKRPVWEVKALMQILIEFMQREIDELDEENVQIRFIGDIEAMPGPVLQALHQARRRTEANTGLVFNIALNYGGRQEILHAARAMAKDYSEGMLTLEDIDEAAFSQRLYTDGLPDPDLIIRTSGEERLSNFLLWQCAYAELVFTQEHWPDFDDEVYAGALRAFQNRDRRYGGLGEDE